ncbi:MAG: DUF4388 domain-containing protein [Nitrospirota bacterium]|jgi:putative nucleotidyltransferase with HDIG domain
MGVKKILIFNENEKERHLLGDLLRAEDFIVFETGRVLESIHYLKKEDIGMVLASQGMSSTETAEFRDIVQRTRPDVTVLFLDAMASDEGKLSISHEGFKQFLQDSIRREDALNGRLGEMKNFLFSFLDRILQVFEVDDRFFFNNDQLVASLSVKIARRMGLDEDTVDAVRCAALLKDIGKVGIQNKLLAESRRFTSNEFLSIKTHPLNAVEILRDVRFPWDVDSIIAQHHENYDGSGYPAGLRGRQISIGARIVHISDSYVAMTTDRPYRKALSSEEAVGEITKSTGKEFDPEVVEVFMQVLKEEPSEVAAKRSILLLERQPTLSALIRLSVDANETKVVHVSNSLDAIRVSKQRQPDLIVADVELLDQKTFIHFYNTMQEIPGIREKPFIFILPNAEYPRHFRGEKLLYLVSPVNMGELVSAIRTMLDGAAPPKEERKKEPRGLSGSLEDFNLTDIIQILNLGLKTAKIELFTEGADGDIYMSHGKIVHASTGSLSGREAFFEMARWASGNFHIVHGETTGDVNIKTDTMHLLLETARVFDEEKRTYGSN